MRTRGLRLAPRDEDRATWCLRCDRLARIGVSPLLLVKSCHRCVVTPREWAKHVGAAVALLAAWFLLLWFVMSTA